MLLPPLLLPLTHLAVAAGLAASLPAAVSAQEGAPASETAPAPGTVQESIADQGVDEVPPAPPLPTNAEEAVSRTSELAKGLEGQPVEVLRAFLDRYMELLDAQGAELARLEGLPLEDPAHASETQVRADLQTMISVSEALAKALTAAGEDAEAERRVLSGLRTSSATTSVTESESFTRAVAIGLDKEVLKARLRPMTLETVEEELAVWLELLRETCVEISAKEIAGMTGSADTTRFNEQAVLLRGQRGRLIERINAILSALEKKGGDGSEARAYMSSVIAAPPITGFKAAVTSLTAWIQSPDGGVAIGLELLEALALLVAAFLISRVVGLLVERGMRRVRGTSSLLRHFVVSSTEKGIVLVGFLMALSAFGVNMAPLVAAIGAAGLVLGLALQGTLGNLASGLMIMVFRPFDVEDIVLTAGAHGRVMGMTLMTTTVRTMDNRTIHVPNGMVWGDVITNVTANHTRRIDMVFGISYGSDFVRAREILLEILEAHDKVLDDPEPNVRMHELADSSVNLITRPWVRTPDYWEVMWDVNETAKQRFDAEGIVIPFPQRDVHHYSDGRPLAAPPAPDQA